MNNLTRRSVLAGGFLLVSNGLSLAVVNRPFPQAGNLAGSGLKPDNLTQTQLNAAVSNYYGYWKAKYVIPSSKVAGDYKVNYDGKGTTVSEAMGYGMLLTVYMAGADPDAKSYFDGLNRFRKRYPSNITPGLMCWKIPADEKTVSGDCATDGDLDMALALLLAYRQWGDSAYLTESTNYLNCIATTLVRGDHSLRLGDWNSAAGQTRPSDFMPGHFRSFFMATGNGLWTNVENSCYLIFNQLQTNYAAATGLVPDFSVKNGAWEPAQPKFLESPRDGDYNYNSCRVPWRLGWAAWFCDDTRARQILSRLMSWIVSHHAAPIDFKAGYNLDGTDFSGNKYNTACFISPTGVAAMVTSNQTWLNSAFTYAKDKKESYYEDSINLLSMFVMSGNAWLLATNNPPLASTDFVADWQYQNPIIAGFHPDPSICRVSNDFYLVCSSFEYFPGVPMFHSRDLAHWEQIGHVLTRPSQLNLDGVKASQGIYAPTLRYHDGLFYMITTLVGQPPHRNFYVTATDPRGPWSEPVVLTNAPGIDPSLCFDDDGRVYYTGNRRPENIPPESKHRQIWLRELDLKQQALVGETNVLVDEGALHDASSAEASHLYKRDGYYYLIIAEGGTGDNHAVTVFRSRDVRGPYEGNKKNPILTHRHLGRDFPIACTGHADLVQTQAGDWWMVLLGVRPYGDFDYNLGRETFLARVVWEGGWPVVNPGVGHVEFSARGPQLAEHRFPAVPARTEFDSTTLGFEWNFLRTPRKNFWSLTERPGWLRLKLRPEKLSELVTPSFVGRRITDFAFTATAAMQFAPQRDGESAGLVVEQSNEFHFRMEVVRDSGQPKIRLTQRRAGVETVLAEKTAPGTNLLLRVSASQPAAYDFDYAGSDGRWLELSHEVDARLLSRRVTGGFTGAFVGLYASGNGTNSTNVADFDWFEYRTTP